MANSTNSTVIENNKRIAKNTLFLYFRTILIMVVSLYTTRVVLNILGIEDYGIFNAVGGVVMMFASVTGALSASISRFVTFELGKEDVARLTSIFISSKHVLYIISGFILTIGVFIGLCFLNTYMLIPVSRITAANWILICSILSFCVSLLAVPYNACIIAHEHMKTYAYVSILDAFLKLFSVYLLEMFFIDKLILYAILTLSISIVIRLTYGLYCKKYFIECNTKGKYDKSIVREILGFSSWSFITNSCWIFNTQGINLLINTYFGVTLNAARGIAAQVENGLMQIADNFNSAMSPQIIKYYAKGQKKEMFTLICRGSKFSFYLLLIFSIPIIAETETILSLWLNNYPYSTTLFIRLAIIGSMIDKTGMTLYTGCISTGKIKSYVIPVAIIGFSVFPITWIAFTLHAPAYATYIVFITIYLFVNITRLCVMKKLLGFSIFEYIKEVYFKILPATVLCSGIAFLICYLMIPSTLRFFVSTFVNLSFSIIIIYFIGLTNEEKFYVSSKLNNLFEKLKR